MIAEQPATLAVSARETIRQNLRLESVPLALPVPSETLLQREKNTGKASATRRPRGLFSSLTICERFTPLWR